MSIVLTGCGTKQNEVVSNESVTATTTQASAVEELKPYTVKWYTVTNGPQKNQAAVQEEVNKYLKDKLPNTTLDMQFLDWSYLDKIKLIISSGEEFDMCFSAGWMEYNAFVAKGAFLPLDDLLTQYAPKTKAQLNPAYIEGPKVNGKLYGVATEKDLAASFGYEFNKKLVEKYKFDITTIKSFKDIEPMLKVIKENEPDIVPLLGGGWLFEDTILERIGGGGMGKVYKFKDDSKIYNQYELPEVMENAKLMHEWFMKGYINKDVASVKSYQGYQKAGNWFATQNQLKPGKAIEDGTAYGYDLLQQEVSKPFASTDDTVGSMMSVSVTSKDPSRAMMIIELMHTDKYFLNLIKNGIENKDYVKVSDNVIDWPKGVDAQTSGYNPGTSWIIGNQYLDYLRPNEDPNKWTAFKTFIDNATVTKYLGFSFNVDPVKAEVAACNDISTKYEAVLKGCSVDPVTAIPKILNELKKAGAEKIIAEKQKQLDAFMATKK